MDVRPDEKAVEPLVVMSFEGMPVTAVEGVMPGLTMDMDAAFPVGTHVRFELEARLANVRYEEGKGRHRGDFIRKQVLVIEGVKLLAAFVPMEQVAGGLAGSVDLVEDDEVQDEAVQTPVGNEDVGF